MHLLQKPTLTSPLIDDFLLSWCASWRIILEFCIMVVKGLYFIL